MKSVVKNSMVEKLKKMLKDKDYYYGWQSNIAMAFYDAYYNYKKKHKKKTLNDKDIITIANEGAKNFLDLLIK